MHYTHPQMLLSLRLQCRWVIWLFSNLLITSGTSWGTLSMLQGFGQWWLFFQRLADKNPSQPCDSHSSLATQAQNLHHLLFSAHHTAPFPFRHSHAVVLYACFMTPWRMPVADILQAAKCLLPPLLLTSNSSLHPAEFLPQPGPYTVVTQQRQAPSAGPAPKSLEPSGCFAEIRLLHLQHP